MIHPPLTRLLLPALLFMAAVHAPTPCHAAPMTDAEFAQIKTQYPQRSKMGLNVGDFTDYGTEQPLLDLMKQSRAWVTPDWKSAMRDPNYKFDENGWPILQPGQTVGNHIVIEQSRRGPSGPAMVTYKGTGKVKISRDVTDIVEEPGRIFFTLTPGNYGIFLEILESDPADPVRDIHVWLGDDKRSPEEVAAAAEQNGGMSPFNPRLLERLKPFGVLRFLDAQRINGSKVTTWAERGRLEDFNYNRSGGAPLEILIELCNVNRSDLWILVPHKADDDYVRQMAEMIKARLRPDLKVYVEYSNEIWNTAFSQTKDTSDKGLELGLSTNPWEAGMRYSAQRSVQVFGIFDEVFGGREAASKRLVRVMAGQAVAPAVVERKLLWKDAYKNTDAVAIAPYFGHGLGSPKRMEEVTGMTPDQIMEKTIEEVSIHTPKGIARHAELAKKYNLRLIAYEGGQHMVGVGEAVKNDQLTQLLIAANRHPAMYEAYTANLDDFFGAGGDLFVPWKNIGPWTKWGSWGLTEFYDENLEDAHKLRAVLDYIKRPNSQ